jgi:hypothetical protein
MTDRVKMVVAQIKHFSQYFLVLFIKRKPDTRININSCFVLIKTPSILEKMPNLRDDHLHPVYPICDFEIRILELNFFFYATQVFKSSSLLCNTKVKSNRLQLLSKRQKVFFFSTKHNT